MKTTEKILKYYFIILLFAFCGACSNDPEPGPEGQRGEKGDQGDKGEQGLQGPKGDKGTANVIYSEWMEPNWNLLNSARNKRMDIDVPELTDNILNSGSVHVYWKTNNGTTFSLPFVSINLGGVPTISRNFYIRRPTEIWIELIKYNADLEVSEYSGGVFNRVRYVIIPGEVLSGGRAATVDYNNYDEVKEFFNLPD